MDEAVSRRNDFDSALDSFVGPLGELEVKCEGLQDRGESKLAHIQERVEAIRVSESDCVCVCVFGIIRCEGGRAFSQLSVDGRNIIKIIMLLQF